MNVLQAILYAMFAEAFFVSQQSWNTPHERVPNLYNMQRMSLSHEGEGTREHASIKIHIEDMRWTISLSTASYSLAYSSEKCVLETKEPSTRSGAVK